MPRDRYTLTLPYTPPMPRHWRTGLPAPADGHYLICHTCTDLGDECEDPECQEKHAHYRHDEKSFCSEYCRAFDAS